MAADKVAVSINAKIGPEAVARAVEEHLKLRGRTGLPVYFGHSRSNGKTSAMYAAMGSEPFGTIEEVFGPGSAYGAPHSRTTVMSLGTGQVIVLTGYEAGRIR